MDSISISRAELIRKGNEAFNAQDFRKARELFIQANYKGGLIRLGDYYMYEKHMPLLAYGYYKRANAKLKIEDLHRRMVMAIANWIGHDKLDPEYQDSLQAGGTVQENTHERDQDGMIAVPVNPLLREQAQLILAQQNSKWN